MSSEEAIEYEEEFDYEAPIGDDEPVPAWHLAILQQRLALYGPHPEGTPWEEFEEELIKDLMEARKTRTS